MTYRELKKEAAGRLSSCPYADNPAFEAEILICHMADLSPSGLLAKSNEIVTDEVCTSVLCACGARLLGEPLQYIIGQWDFYGLTFFCGKGCLIPRTETELSVEKAIELAPRGARILDLCTGSGAIAISLLHRRPDLTGTALDISSDALTFAEKNAKLHGVKDRLKLLNLPLESYTPDAPFDVIISNPPYVKTADVEAFSEEMKKEPRIAFDGGEDGLCVYRKIAEKYTAGTHLAKGGVIILEAGYDTVREAEKLMKARGFETEVLSDTFGVERVCVARRSENAQE